MTAREFWKAVGRLTVSGIDGYARNQEAVQLYDGGSWEASSPLHFQRG
ncbi:hypothetical protein [Streptomyces puniciscabiei]